RVARPLAAEPKVSPLASPPPVAPPPPDAAAPMPTAPTPASPAIAKRSTPAPLAAADKSVAPTREQPVPPESESITVTGQRIAPRALESASPATAIASTESAPAADTVGASEALKAQVGSPQALRLAAETGDLKRLQRFLDQLTDVNSRDDAGRTALLLAT